MSTSAATPAAPAAGNNERLVLGLCVCTVVMAVSSVWPNVAGLPGGCSCPQDAPPGPVGA
jgi:hypothetical protein